MFDGTEHLALAFVELIFLFLARFLGVDLLCVYMQYPLAVVFLLNNQMNRLIPAPLGMEFNAMIVIFIRVPLQVDELIDSRAMGITSSYGIRY